MHISFNTEELSELDLRVLQAVLGTEAPSTTATAAPAAKPAPKAEKAAAPAKATKKAEPEPEPDEDEDDTDEATAEDGDDEVTKEQAVALATKLVSSGKAAKVKAALADCGAKRVSELADDKVAQFVAALS